MVSCYDCEYFGTDCLGIVPPIKYRDRIDEYCKKFKSVQYRHELYKPDGRSRL
ncbi:MAG: hypothetical protein ACUVT7_04375 [Thermoplasmata archaeon]